MTDSNSGTTVSGATVILSPSGKTQTTGYDGTYKFPELEERQYTITVQKNGYSTNRKSVTIGSDERVEVNISITKLSE
ncbi:MAG: carboxypeptidase-like regulatory domain-containing protein [Lachnospiraceae bacterium]|nr:carboxypeptidase-like regulatory domain-containing protein [Lachnospiraceae bacterium]